MSFRIPEKVDGYRSEVINALIDCVRALCPKKSATLLIDVHPDGARYEVKRPGASGQGMPFSGRAFIYGHRTTGLNSDATKLWVAVNLEQGTCSEVNDPPNPFPPNMEYYEKSFTTGDIHITR